MIGRPGADMPHKQALEDLRRLQLSLIEIASLLDAIEGRSHPLLRTSADNLVSQARPPHQKSLADYTARFATTLAKSGASLKS
jgi:hypothetical protein